MDSLFATENKIEITLSFNIYSFLHYFRNNLIDNSIISPLKKLHIKFTFFLFLYYSYIDHTQEKRQFIYTYIAKG